MSKGPLSVRWGALPTLEPPHAGASPRRGRRSRTPAPCRGASGSSSPTTGSTSAATRSSGTASARAPPPLAPGERATVEAASARRSRPGRTGFAFDLVAEGRAWFSELGGAELAADVEVAAARRASRALDLPAGSSRADDWARARRRRARRGLRGRRRRDRLGRGALHRRPRALEPYEPGAGRVPGFSAPLLCPSVLDGVELERLPDVAGLPAYAAPRDEPWIYDGRIVLHESTP